MLEKNVIFPFTSINYMFSVNYIFLLNITYIFAIITCLEFLAYVYEHKFAKKFRFRYIKLYIDTFAMIITILSLDVS